MSNFEYGENLIFLVGCPRSGTTHLQKLISAHPEVYTGRETHFFDLIGPLFENWQEKFKGYREGSLDFFGMACYFEEEELYTLLRKFIENVYDQMKGSNNKKPIFLDKTPSHALYIHHIHSLLPKARFIHIIRDARDVIASLVAASKSFGRSWGAEICKGRRVFVESFCRECQISIKRATLRSIL